MHYHIEVVLPPTDNIEKAIKRIFEPFCEHTNDGEYNEGGWWDWYVIGGRFTGNKLMARYDEAKLDEFYKWLKDEKVTVSGMQAGKQSLEPADQIPKIDAKWNEMFPHDPPLPCPIFSHSSDQYSSSSLLPGDIQRVDEVAGNVRCSRFIVADAKGNVTTMFEHNGWNREKGSFDKTDFDGTVGNGLAIANPTPGPDWLVVTVDAHC